ncbi:MAG: rod shape-determining protein MreC [Aquabacterium sp.]
MPLATLDRTPPPFFRQGLPALTKLALCSALAIFLMAADTRLQLVAPLRDGLATALLPLQQALAVPVDAARQGAGYLGGLAAARAAEAQARVQLARQAERASQVERLTVENIRLRALLELAPSLPVRAQTAQVLYESADAFSRKVVIDRGRTQGVSRGAPVITDAGVVGQVTRVYALTAEVTLLSDKDAALPVLNLRTQQRSAAFGAGDGVMELRYIAANADVKVGDLLQTNGLDGVYPPGLPVAVVTAVERRADAGFARILARPSAQPDGVRHVMVLEPAEVQMPPRPVPEPAAPVRRVSPRERAP